MESNYFIEMAFCIKYTIKWNLMFVPIKRLAISSEKHNPHTHRDTNSRQHTIGRLTFILYSIQFDKWSDDSVFYWVFMVFND